MDSDSLPLSELNRLDEVADQFERAWQAGENPQIEPHLGDIAEPGRTALLRELLAIELDHRLRRGEAPDAEQYLRRFPTHVQLVASIFGEAQPLASTVTIKGCGTDSPTAESPAQPSSAPAQIGRYQVLSWLDGGTFGHVYVAYDEQLDRRVAIKVPSPKLLASSRARSEFIREARSVARLKHEAIVTAYDFGQEPDGQCYIVYEFIEGTNLAQRLLQGPMAPHEVALLVAQVADALHHAHLQGLIHRDIKPANILLDKQGRPRVADFGLAVREQDLNEHRGTGAGTYPYMSPEQVRREGHLIDGRTDIYSLGVVLYEMLCGRRPFLGQTEAELTEQILHREARPPRQVADSVPAELERICLKALSKRMTDRYTTAKDMAEDLLRAAWSMRSRDPDGHLESSSGNKIQIGSSFESLRERPDGLVGTRLGRFLVRRFIAAGGSGLVFGAFNSTTGEEICLKIFYPFASASHTAAAIRSISRAIRATVALKHPNIARLLDVFPLDFRDQRTLCLISELVLGKRLDEWSQEQGTGPTAVTARFRLAIAIAETLARAHECTYIDESGFECRGLLHGDIKPSNVLVRPDNFPVLVDFMLIDAQQMLPHTFDSPVDDQQIATDAYGTPGYMPPEQEREGIVTVRADVFALGRTLDQLFYSGDLNRSSIEREPVEWSSKLRELLAAMTASSPEARPRDMQVVVERLWQIRARMGGSENVQFSVYRPKVVQPLKWYTMLAFAHLSQLRADAPPDEPDPVMEVERQARQLLAEKISQQQKTTHDSRHAVPREGEITFVPDVPGIEFNPPRRMFLWDESVHREEFRMRARRELDGQTARGRLTVYLESIILAEIVLNIRVDSTHVVRPSDESFQTEQARPYRKIFASYSRDDEQIVAQFARFARVLGDDFIHRFTHLRAGEVGSESVAQLIEQSDIFQLFWSSNSMMCPRVRHEWEHALALQRPNFIRPTYWEEPLPTCPEKNLPPEELRRLHFERLPLMDRLPHAGIIRWGAGPSGAGAAAAAESEFKLDQEITAATEPHAAQPRSFGRYLVEQASGRGAFGEVFLGHDPRTRQRVWIKTLYVGYDRSRQRLERAMSETRQLARLEHPGIASIRDLGIQGDLCYIVTDFVDGKNLRHWLHSNGPTREQIVQIIASVADALAYLHTQGVVHHEVQTSNIVIQQNGSAILLMTGTQHRFLEISGTFMLGSPTYIAPEQARGDRVDGRADIYSLGAVLYESLCGRPPFEGSVFELMNRVLNDEPAPLRQFDPSIPSALEQICLRALAKNASDRYATAADMADDLRRTLAGRSTATTLEPIIRGSMMASGARSGDDDSDRMDEAPKPAAARYSASTTEGEKRAERSFATTWQFWIFVASIVAAIALLVWLIVLR